MHLVYSRYYADYCYVENSRVHFSSLDLNQWYIWNW